SAGEHGIEYAGIAAINDDGTAEAGQARNANTRVEQQRLTPCEGVHDEQVSRWRSAIERTSGGIKPDIGYDIRGCAYWRMLTSDHIDSDQIFGVSTRIPSGTEQSVSRIKSKTCYITVATAGHNSVTQDVCAGWVNGEQEPGASVPASSIEGSPGVKRQGIHTSDARQRTDKRSRPIDRVDRIKGGWPCRTTIRAV